MLLSCKWNDKNYFMKLKHHFFLMFFFYGFCAHSQPINPWLADGINNGMNRGRSLEMEQRQQMEWEFQKRAQIQRERKLLDTKYFGALAVAPEKKGRVTWGGGALTEESIRTEVFEACGAKGCRVVQTFANTCGMVAIPVGDKELKKTYFAVDDDPEEAIRKSVRACEVDFGKGNCAYARRDMGSPHSAFCTGYKYGIYSTQ